MKIQIIKNSEEVPEDLRSGVMLFTLPTLRTSIVEKLYGYPIPCPKNDYTYDDMYFKVIYEDKSYEYYYLYAKNEIWRVGGVSKKLNEYVLEFYKQLINLYENICKKNNRY